MLGSSPGPPATPSAKECGGHALRGSRAPSGVSQGVPWASVPLPGSADNPQQHPNRGTNSCANSPPPSSPQSTTRPGAVEPCDPTSVSASPHTPPPRPSPHTLARAGGGLGTVRSPAALETGHSGQSGPVVCSGDGCCDHEPRPPEGAAAPTQPNPPPPPRPSERAYVRHRMFRCPPDRPALPPPPPGALRGQWYHWVKG